MIHIFFFRYILVSNKVYQAMELDFAENKIYGFYQEGLIGIASIIYAR